jgi:hypothetical protein
MKSAGGDDDDPSRRKRKEPRSNALFQVIANATAAAATINTAMAAASTEMQVASYLTSESRWTLRAACRAGTVGIAGRKSTRMDFSSQC